MAIKLNLCVIFDISCLSHLQVEKRDDDSSLMQLKEEVSVACPLLLAEFINLLPTSFVHMNA